jgi:HAD superfamily hydrolase (TIGR01509 family)
MKYRAIIFDFDGVLLESEFAGNRQIAEYLTGIGHPTSVEQSMTHFMGLAGDDFLRALENWIGRPLPEGFHAARAVEDRRVLEEGLEAVVGAVAFVESLPENLPRAIASSSRKRWITRHLDHLGLRSYFGDNIFSGHEDVERGKPEPDLYWHAAKAIGVEIQDCVIIEDSPIGVTGALASGAEVIGLCAGRHCTIGHADRLRSLGVSRIAAGFDEVAQMIGLTETG